MEFCSDLSSPDPPRDFRASPELEIALVLIPRKRAPKLAIVVVAAAVGEAASRAGRGAASGERDVTVMADFGSAVVGWWLDLCFAVVRDEVDRRRLSWRVYSEREDHA
jgi:hypothetical protein